MSLELTEDKFLGGRLVAAQPKRGFRAGHDAVLLAAAVPARAGERALELGSGSGVASLCLALRVPGLTVQGIEIERELVDLANANAARNGMKERVAFAPGNAEKFEAGQGFHHVFFNPPFHPDTGHASPVAARDRAMRDVGEAVALWTRSALKAIRPGGTLTAILRADRQAEIVDIVGGRGTTVLPLFPRAGEAPKRVIVRIDKEGDAPLRVAAGLVLHLADGKPTPEAEGVLRHAGAVSLA